MASYWAAGLNPRAKPQFLQLFVEGKEVPISLKSKRSGRLGLQDTIEFYADGLDTPSTDTRSLLAEEWGKTWKTPPAI